jgi:ATP-dependent helicase/nuclease subunit B
LFRLPPELLGHLERGGTVLVPSRQRLRAVQLAYASRALESGARVWRSPDVLIPSAWLRRECEQRAALLPAQWPRPLSRTEEWALWRQATQAAAGAENFFDIGALAQSLQEASALAAEYDIRLPGGSSAGEAGLLGRAHALYTARCLELGAASVDALAGRLRAAAPAAAHVALCGFTAPPPRLAALCGATLYSGAAPLTTPRVLRLPDAVAEQDAIAAWCATRLRAQPDARLLIVLPGPAGGRERLAALIGAALDAPLQFCVQAAARTLVGIEGGQPLGELPLAAHALTSLALLSGAPLDLQALSAWLPAVGWERPEPTARAALAAALRTQRRASFTLSELSGALQLVPADLKSAARALDAQLRRAAAKLGEGGAAPARSWSERIDAALSLLGWPGPLGPPGGSLAQTRLRWRELLEEFGALSASLGVLPRAEALGLLRALALSSPYRPADEDVPVTLSPALADPIVHYDGIWVGALSADVLPEPLAPDAFLPLPAQLASGVPQASSAGRRAQAQALLAAWRAATRDLTLSVPSRERDLEVLPSPLLGDWPLEELAPAAAWLPAHLQRSGLTETLEDARGATWNPLAPLPQGTRALTLQSSCAFRAYAELRLGALAQESAEPGVPMDMRGLLLHAALQLLWQRLRDSAALQGLSEQALTRLIGESVAQAAQALQAAPRHRKRPRRRHDEGQFELFTALPPALMRECARAERLILTLCRLERTREPFRVLATEAAAELALGGGLVRMRLDRIDAIAQGQAILDYKSGRPLTADWYGERPTHPQLLAYLAAIGTQVVALATVNLTAREVRFTGIAASGGLLPKVKAVRGAAEAGAGAWQQQQSAWSERIAQLMRAFLAGEARVEPAPGACEYCHVTDICRIGAHQEPPALPAAEDADE